jgi:hypothetical protein
MSRIHMLAGAVASGGEPATEQVSAYVVLADRAKSRLFKVAGKSAAPNIEELGAATTLDLKRFQEETKRDLAGLGPVRPADATWVCDVLRVHLRCDLGV